VVVTRLTLEFTDDEWTRLQAEAKRQRHKLEACCKHAEEAMPVKWWPTPGGWWVQVDTEQGDRSMIKEIEELQVSVLEDFACTDPEVSRNRLFARLSDTLGLLHQLAVKVERLERRRQPAPYVPDSEEGGL
jgi:hypothetical protein